eukprot:scaffold44392_cov75-Attheya_sp.AAC.1
MTETPVPAYLFSRSSAGAVILPESHHAYVRSTHWNVENIDLVAVASFAYAHLHGIFVSGCHAVHLSKSRNIGSSQLWTKLERHNTAKRDGR